MGASGGLSAAAKQVIKNNFGISFAKPEHSEELRPAIDRTGGRGGNGGGFSVSSVYSVRSVKKGSIMRSLPESSRAQLHETA